jgi:hypothetical protein
MGTAGSAISLSNRGHPALFVADVVACYSPSGDQHKPVTPARLPDTRKGIGSPAARVAGAKHVTL